MVLSLGGGAFVNSKIRKNILANSKSFWLYLDIKLLTKRLINSKKRPLLKNKDLENTLEEIYTKRENTYSYANYKINCNKLSADLITDKIIKIYENN